MSAPRPSGGHAEHLRAGQALSALRADRDAAQREAAARLAAIRAENERRTVAAHALAMAATWKPAMAPKPPRSTRRRLTLPPGAVATSRGREGRA